MLIDFDMLTVLIFTLCYILACILIHKKCHKEPVFYIFSTVMACYFMCVAKLTLFPIIMIGMPSNLKESINLIPFCNGIQKTDLLNLAMTVPLGFGMPFLVNIRNTRRAALLGLAAGLAIETAQYLETFLTNGFSYRIIDINDVIFNFVGTVTGFLGLYLFSRIFLKLSRQDLNIFGGYVYDICASVTL